MERFRREVLLARRITHFNVCRIFELYDTFDPRGDRLSFPRGLRVVQHRDSITGAVGALRAELGVEGIGDEAASWLHVGMDVPTHLKQVRESDVLGVVVRKAPAS